MKIRQFKPSFLLFFLMIVANAALAQPPATDSCSAVTDYVEWINCRVNIILQARINQRGNTKQTETPSIAGSSTSLIDQSSGPDLISAAVNLLGLSDNPDSTQKKSFSFTASAYSLYATFTGNDPLDPAIYLRNRNWRRVFFTLGQEAPTDDASKSTDRATIAGIKVLIWDKRDASDPRNRALLSTIADGVRKAAPNFSATSAEVRLYLYRTLAGPLGLATNRDGNPASAQDFINFENTFFVSTRFRELLGRLSDDERAQIDKLIENRIGPEVELAKTTREVIEQIRKAPQFSLAVQSKTRKEGADEYKAEAIFDVGIHNRVNFTLNGAFEYKDSKAIGADTRGGSVTGQLQFQVTPDKRLIGRNPIYFYVSGEGKWMNGMDSTAKLQTKIKIPIVEGIDLPISFTFANRTELIDEKEVRGQFGFTIDLARLAKAVGFR